MTARCPICARRVDAPFVVIKGVPVQVSELHRALAGVSHRTLTQPLRELESHGIVRRKIHRQVPPKVEYSLTPVGETLRPVIAVMHDWAEEYAKARSRKR